MNATTIFPVVSVPGFLDHAMAGTSWQIPQAVIPTNRTVRRSISRTKKKLTNTPIKPVQVTMTEYENGCFTPAICNYKTVRIFVSRKGFRGSAWGQSSVFTIQVLRRGEN